MANRTYILELRNGGQRRLTVPETYRVTYGPLIGHQKGEGGGCALRIYADKTKDEALACFRDVTGFRDAALVIEEKIVRTERKVIDERDRQGGKQYVAEARIEEWVNPDEPGVETQKGDKTDRFLAQVHKSVRDEDVFQ